MNKLEKAKEIIKESLESAKYGIFNSRNIVGDEMFTVYNQDGLVIDICYRYGYFEVFGLSDEEFHELCEFYYELREVKRNYIMHRRNTNDKR